MSKEALDSVASQTADVASFSRSPMSRRSGRMFKQPDNPMDRCTVFSIYPLPVEDRKATIQPGYFKIEAGSYDSPARLLVGPGSYWRDIDPEQPLVEISNGAVLMAQSFVEDYVSCIIGHAAGIARPGLFWLHGNLTVQQLKTNHPQALTKAKNQQDAWYRNLIKLADIGWARTNGNPLCISDDMRLAARELNLKDKDWMKDFQMAETKPCPACGASWNPKYPMCGNCKTVINQELYTSLNLRAESLMQEPVKPTNPIAAAIAKAANG